jgi:nitrite reductase/ring-hydroxylating ferredoxin subunit
MEAMTAPRPLAFPPSLQAPGAATAGWFRVATLEDLPLGAMLRVTHGDLDVLLAHTADGIVATEDRCPHMSAPLSIGALEGCVVACPLHKGRFDLATGDVVVFPTTGGLDADGASHPTWSPPGTEPKPEPPDTKARARALTRVRRMRYYPLRITGDAIEIAIPT